MPEPALVATLVGHTQPITGVAWSPDGKQLASAGRDHTARVWDVERQQVVHTFTSGAEELCVAWHPRFRTIAVGGRHAAIALRTLDTTGGIEQTRMLRHHRGAVRSVAWSHDGTRLASASDDKTAVVWSERGTFTLAGHDNWVRSIAWAPDDRRIATGGDDGTIRLWDARTGAETARLTGHAAWVHRVIWSPDGRQLVSTSEDMTVRVWDATSGHTQYILEGHTGPIAGAALHAGLLATKSEDGTVRLWRTDTWEPVATIAEPCDDHASLYASVAFHPFSPILATLGERDRVVRVWKLDDVGHAVAPAHYRNAKAVVLGDSGVGKSGLALALAGEPYRATESTHGCRVWSLAVPPAHGESRELVLWDLAGQAGYRVVHQLHLDQVAVALLVFDAKSDVDPALGVRYWNRALEQARRVQGQSAPPLRKLLVLARADRGRSSLGAAQLASLAAELGADGYVETSAKEGWGIDELRARVHHAIPWDELAGTVSSELFRDIKRFLLEQKRRSLSSGHDLHAHYQTASGRTPSRAEFDACLGALEARGLVRRLSFGDIVLLQPEQLDAYAAAILQAARDDPHGLGSVLEADIRDGRFRIPADERIADRRHEQLLLIATVEDLLRHDVALREGSQLVMPSQATAPDGERVALPAALVVAFEGPIDTIYATLLVRLSHSGSYHRAQVWRSGCAFRAEAGGTCSLELRSRGDGAAELEIGFAGVSAQTRAELERYLIAHVERGALPSSVRREVRFACSCGEPVPARSVEARLASGKTSIRCAACDEPVSLVSAATPALDLARLDQAADAQRARDVASSTLQGKRATRHFDVFLCHHASDKPAVRALARRLEEAGVLPWLDEEQLQPGLPWQPELQRQLGDIHAAAVLVGEQFGPWQDREVQVLLDELSRRGHPVIPVILPGCERPAELPLFMRAMTIVDMRATVPDPLDQLVWGITGKRPRS